MSQSIDSSAIEQIRDLSLTQLLEERLTSTDCPAIALPEKVQVVSLERYNANRFRFRGNLKTANIADFVRYCRKHEDDGVSCFIDAENMAAVTIFNLGTLELPGHADNTAVLGLKKTAPFSALLDINGVKNRQKELAEWLEDWSEYLTAFTADGEVLDIKKAIGGVRKITIESSRNSDHEDSDFGAKRSVFESVEAKSKEEMPAAFEFKCISYEGLGERRFHLRYSVLTGGDSPILVLRIVQLEEINEAIATEFKELLEHQFNNSKIDTFIGTFKA